MTIIDTSSDTTALAVACYDLSQFLQYHPCGRIVVADLKAKDRVMKLMNHENTEVRKNALLCVQRLYLGAKYASFLQAWEIEFLYLDPENPHWLFFRMAEPWLRKTSKILVQYVLLLFDFRNRCIINNQSHTLLDVIKCPWACCFFPSKQCSTKWKYMIYVNCNFADFPLNSVLLLGSIARRTLLLLLIFNYSRCIYLNLFSWKNPVVFWLRPLYCARPSTSACILVDDNIWFSFVLLLTTFELPCLYLKNKEYEFSLTSYPNL